VRAVPRLCIKLCPGIHLTTEERWMPGHNL